MPPGHGTGCFYAPPRKSVHKLVHILGARKKHPQIPEVALVDFTPDRRQWLLRNAIIVQLHTPIAIVLIQARPASYFEVPLPYTSCYKYVATS